MRTVRTLAIDTVSADFCFARLSLSLLLVLLVLTFAYASDAGSAESVSELVSGLVANRGDGGT